MAEDKQQLAEDRTDWAEDRTNLASERTYAGWLRTGMAAIAVALGMKAVFGSMEPTWIAKAVATLFLLAAVLIFLAARRQACRTQARFKEHDVHTHETSTVTLLAVLLILATLGTGGVLWAL